MIELRRLQALHAVVATGSVRAAAQSMGYTASAISQQIAALERDVDVVLLEPSGRGVRPTAAGTLLAEHAGRVIEHLARAEAELVALKAGELGALRLATFATAGAELVPLALSQVRSQLPGLDITVRSGERDEALELLRSAVIDLAIIETHEYPTSSDTGLLVFRRLLTDPFQVLLPRDHRLASEPSVDLALLAGDAWIRPRCEVGCCHAETSNAFALAGFEPRWVAEADDYWPAQGYVAAGLGVALVPGLALSIMHRGTVARPLQGSAMPTRAVFAVTRPALAETTMVTAMLDALREGVDHPLDVAERRRLD